MFARFKPLFIALAVLHASSFALAETTVQQMPAGKYVLDATHASLTWKVSHLGLSNYTARFTDFDATVTLDPKDVTQSTVTATVNPASVETDYPNAEKKDFDAKLAKGKNWFNSAEFPEITFTSNAINVTGENTADITGELTFLGITKPVTLHTTLNGAMLEQPFAKKPALGFSATATLQRSEWGFSTYVPNIGDKVTLQIEAEFLKADEAAVAGKDKTVKDSDDSTEDSEEDSADDSEE
jgi:polyisoprenoid-binding protein YceI